MSIVTTLTNLAKPLIKALEFLGPGVLLGIRLYLANVFWQSGVNKLQTWESTLFLFQYEYQVPFLSPTIAAYLQEHTEPQDRIAILGSEPQIFFYSKRRSASGQIYMYPLMEDHDFALQMQMNFINDIETEKPKYIIDVHVRKSWLENDSSNKHILEWKEAYLKSHYQLVGAVELYDDRTDTWWDEEIKPITAENSILIYKRK